MASQRQHAVEHLPRRRTVSRISQAAQAAMRDSQEMIEGQAGDEGRIEGDAEGRDDLEGRRTRPRSRTGCGR